ncbi:hypothetical protein ACQ1Q5_00065 [Ornithobacterium rhinotracheale]
MSDSNKKLSFTDKYVIPLTREYKDFIKEFTSVPQEIFFRDGERRLSDKEKKFLTIFEEKNKSKVDATVSQDFKIDRVSRDDEDLVVTKVKFHHEDTDFVRQIHNIVDEGKQIYYSGASKLNDDNNTYEIDLVHPKELNAYEIVEDFVKQTSFKERNAVLINEYLDTNYSAAEIQERLDEWLDTFREFDNDLVNSLEEEQQEFNSDYDILACLFDKFDRESLNNHEIAQICSQLSQQDKEGVLVVDENIYSFLNYEWDLRKFIDTDNLELSDTFNFVSHKEVADVLINFYQEPELLSQISKIAINNIFKERAPHFPEMEDFSLYEWQDFEGSGKEYDMEAYNKAVEEYEKQMEQMSIPEKDLPIINAFSDEINILQYFYRQMIVDTSYENRGDFVENSSKIIKDIFKKRPNLRNEALDEDVLNKIQRFKIKQLSNNKIESQNKRPKFKL